MQAELEAFDIKPAHPFLKWAGGKRHLLAELERFLPPTGKYSTYFEPFLGSGALFFHLKPKDAVLSDSIQDLITTYVTVRDDVESVIAKLSKHETFHRKRGGNYYYQIRDAETKELTHVEQAARFIYLNKTCYNGLYRVNGHNKFNVPVGRHENPKICDAQNLRLASHLLKGKQIQAMKFEVVLASMGKRDFAYLDPPYWPGFTNYNGNGFDYEDQVRLSTLFRDLHKRGALLMMSNGDQEKIKQLYKGFRIRHIESRVFLSGLQKGRKAISELVITNYDPATNELIGP